MKSKPKVQVVEEPTEQVTKEPEADKPVNRNKNPKKVHAGKMLAKKNKEARDALKRQQEMEAGSELGDTPMAPGEEVKESSWLPEMSFGTVLSVVGVGIALADIVSRMWGRLPMAPPFPSEWGTPPWPPGRCMTRSQAAVDNGDVSQQKFGGNEGVPHEPQPLSRFGME